MAQDYNLGRVQGKGLWIADSTFTTNGTITLGSGFTISPLVEDYVIDKDTNNVYAIATISGTNPFNFTTNGTPIFTLGGGNDINIIEGKTTSIDFRILDSILNINNLKSIRLYPYDLNNYTYFISSSFNKSISYCNLTIEMYSSIKDTFKLENFVISDDLKTMTFTPITITPSNGTASNTYTITNLNKIEIDNGTLILYADNIEIKTNDSSRYFTITNLSPLNSYANALMVDNIFVGYTRQGRLPYNIEERVALLEQQIQAIAQIMEVDLTSLNKLTTNKEE